MDEKGIVYEHTINYYETDRMGIVHHSNYIRFFEEARIDYLKKIGLDYKKVEDMGLISSRLVKYNGMKLSVEYNITNEAGELVTTGKSEHCLLDADMKPVNIKRNYPDIYKRLKEEVDL